MWFFHFHQSFFSSVETLKRSKVCSAANGDSLFDGYRCNNLVTCSFPAVASWPCFTLFNLGRGWGGDHACFRIYSPSFTFNLLLWWLVRLDVICTNKDNDLPKNNPDSYPPPSSLPSPVFPGSWSNSYPIQFHKWVQFECSPCQKII